MSLLNDYMDEDMAYLVGLLFAHGTLIDDSDSRRLIIEFPYRILDSRAPTESGIEYIIPDKIKSALVDRKSVLGELLGVPLEIEASDGNVQYVAKFSTNSMVWRNLMTISGGKKKWDEFVLSPYFFEFPEGILRSFIRGFADAAAMPSEKDAYINGANRIVLQISHHNWELPIQLCLILQTRLSIPVSHILWGHPSLRGSFKEHRMRIFACDFLPIGFGFDFKQNILEALCEANVKFGIGEGQPCNPKVKRVKKQKKRNPEARSERLPEAIRKHFNCYWKICQELECKQGKKGPQLELYVEDEDIE